MKYMSVKAYAELVDKSDKTIYKQIKKGSLDAVKVKKGYQVCVDANMLKRLQKVQKALDEAQAALKTAKEEEHAKSTKTSAASAPTKSVKKVVAKKPLKKTVKKPVAKKTVKKSPVKKRK